MKKLSACILTVIMLLSFSACSSNKLADIYNEDEVIRTAKSAVEVINTKDYDAMAALFRDDLKEEISADTFRDAWDNALTGAGEFEKYSTITVVGQTDSSTAQEYAVAMLMCKYANSTLTYTISMDQNLEIVGMYMK
jgi:hypothetical protein